MFWVFLTRSPPKQTAKYVVCRITQPPPLRFYMIYLPLYFSCLMF